MAGRRVLSDERVRDLGRADLMRAYSELREGLEELVPECWDPETNDHPGDYMQEVFEVDGDTAGGFSVQWCKECGCVSVDSTMDGRIMRCGKLYFPGVFKKIQDLLYR